MATAVKKTGVVSLTFVWDLRLKLRAEADRLRAEANKLWAEAILEAFGNIPLKWEWRLNKNDYECHLENGQIFKP